MFALAVGNRWLEGPVYARTRVVVLWTFPSPAQDGHCAPDRAGHGREWEEKTTWILFRGRG